MVLFKNSNLWIYSNMLMLQSSCISYVLFCFEFRFAN